MSTHADEVWPRGIPAVGQRAERTRAVSKRDIELFTEISGDRNPLHYDEAWRPSRSRFDAKSSCRAASPAQFSTLSSPRTCPDPGTVFLHVDWSFKAPVRPGDEITGRVEVLEVRSRQADHEAEDRGSCVDDGTVVLRGRGALLHDAAEAVTVSVAVPARVPASAPVS